MFRHFCLPISNGNNAKKTNQETFHITIAIVWIIDSEKRNDRLISTYYCHVCHEIFGRYNFKAYHGFIKKEKIFASNYCEKYSEELVMNVYESREIIISDRKSFIDTTTI